MIQNIIAISIVFFAAGFTIFSVVKSLMTGKSSHCDGCSGCSLKDMSCVEQQKQKPENQSFRVRNLNISVKKLNHLQ